ncbi:MAG: D-alanyl-D-alanine carboxypeptidase/D-alanyl-D-alanine-endopeptidase [Gemmatimonadetes bacterium]|nr:MAG: D-alanyl-D-alanine carboxypeptidase/D-alanyl-D-alanine-endopeptidase [Gemmatimonadota bacterium]
MRWCTILLVIWGIWTARSQAQPADVQAQIEALIQRSTAADALWSVSFRDTAGVELARVNSRTRVTPASNLKLITSAAILQALGPDFRYQTDIWGDGQLIDGVWEGDIYIVGSGDPSISGRFYRADRWFVFEQFYRQLAAAGIRTITGDLVGNDAFFDDEPYPHGWEWDDLSFYYAVELSALSFNENCVDLVVEANTPVGSAPSISWFPFNTDYVQFINEQQVQAPGTRYVESYRRLLGTNTILLRSKLPQGYRETESLSVHKPTYFFLDSFWRFLAQKGISIEGGIRRDRVQRNWTKIGFQHLARHTSEPLSRLIEPVNKHSHNFFTEMLLKTAAAYQYGTPGTTENGLKWIQTFAEQMGFDPERLVLKDGSGLSSATLITTAEMTDFLVRMRDTPHFEVFENSLSIAGVDGSLDSRFHRLANKIRGKSGSLSGTRSHSGYLTTQRGHTIAFSLITNHYPVRTSVIDRLHDDILWLAFETF